LVTCFSPPAHSWSPFGFIGDLFFSARVFLVANQLHWSPFYLRRRKSGRQCSSLEPILSPPAQFWSPIGFIGAHFISARAILVANGLHWSQFFTARAILAANRLQWIPFLFLSRNLGRQWSSVDPIFSLSAQFWSPIVFIVYKGNSTQTIELKQSNKFF
jgi:lipid-A-disaccharide synthase-like uncharacterized protein